ncbi:unnamed protein product, partial [Allacma fusca]
DYTGS